MVQGEKAIKYEKGVENTIFYSTEIKIKTDAKCKPIINELENFIKPHTISGSIKLNLDMFDPKKDFKK